MSLTMGTKVDPHILAGEVKRRGRELGFDLVGIAPASGSAYRDYFRRWLDEGRAGSMQYLSNRFAERVDPSLYFPGAASVICVGMNYHVGLNEARPASGPAKRGRVARYALGEDYHLLMKGRLHELADWLRGVAGGETRACVDTAPVMEKELAARAGIGWLGKNTCIINEGIGSWLLLGEILTTLELPFDDPAIDRCGSCRRCIDACPTNAITEPYQLDARRCISYLTIEHRGEIEAGLQKQMGDWIYGCDICQDVCPWNSKAVEAIDPALTPRFADGRLDARGVLDWTAEDYSTTLRRSAMKRVKLPQLKRNARIVLDNSGEGDS
jgi:epoxyqueuosine reductase